MAERANSSEERPLNLTIRLKGEGGGLTVYSMVCRRR